MRYVLSQVAITDNAPACHACGAPTVFAQAADVLHDNRVYLIFKCSSCTAGETRVWRQEWQYLANMLVADEN